MSLAVLSVFPTTDTSRDAILIIASTTLTSNNEDTIADALSSVVDLVDLCIVIDTGVTDNSLNVARKIAKSKLVLEKYTWQNHFSAARNFALKAAEKHAATWALTVDTDERITADPYSLRQTLSSTESNMLLMAYENGRYTKERLFRLPAAGEFIGPTHEHFSIPGTKVITGATFTELDKSEADYEKKFQRDVEILQAHLQSHADEPRWHYYLGDSLRNLGRYEAAISAYRKCVELNGWDEESAWACFQAARCYEELGKFQEVIEVAAVGMSRHPAFAELPWYAAYASSKLGDHQKAIYWAQLAIPWGLYEGRGAEVHRIGFRHVPALFEGPYDVLRFAYAALGLSAEQKIAEDKFERAVAARLLYETPGMQ